MTEQQAVVTQPDAQAAPAAEGTNAQTNDLDSLLNEYKADGESQDKPDAKITEAPKEDTAKLLAELKQETAWMKNERERQTKERTDAEFSKTVKSVKGDLPISDILVEGYLQQLAMKDKRLAQAYLHKESNPEAWNKIEKQLQKNLKAEIERMPSKDATEIMNQVDSAVRNAKQTAPSGSKPLSQMTDRELNEAANKLMVSRG